MHSKLRILPLALTYIMTISFSCLFYILFGILTSLLHESSWLVLAYILLLSIFLFFFLSTISSAKYLIVKKDYVFLIYLAFPFFYRKIKWKDIDYAKPVTNYGRYTTARTLWFFKNDRLKFIISSFYYSNYDDLRNNIPVKIVIDKKITTREKFTFLLGFKNKK